MLHLPPPQYDFIYRKASYAMWKRYRINKEELRMLGVISWYLAWRGKVLGSQQNMLDEITGNGRERTRMWGYTQGLLAGKFIGSYEYVSKPGSMVIGISTLGVRVLKEFATELQVMAARYSAAEGYIGVEPADDRVHKAHVRRDLAA